VFENQKDFTFAKVEQENLVQSGTNCLDKMDWDEDGRDEILACSREKAGTRLLKNTEQGLLDFSSKLEGRSPSFSVSDGKFIELTNDDLEDLAIFDRRKGLLIYENKGISNFPFSSLTRRISLSAIVAGRIEIAELVQNGLLSFDSFDANGDGAQDIYVGLTLPSAENPDSYLGDLIFLGPEFRKRIVLPEKPNPTHVVKKFDESSIIVSEAGPNWPGKVYFLKNRNSLPN